MDFCLRVIIATNVKRLRKEAGLNQTELGGKMGRSRQWVSNVERCKTAVNVDAIDKLAQVLEVTSSELLLTPTVEDCARAISGASSIGNPCAVI